MSTDTTAHTARAGKLGSREPGPAADSVHAVIRLGAH